ncbi:hypothetical protein HII28_07000 [Planctomonas sp. JC2975]|uniref:hypothetical protein n=1 Tax=Planctomonas sp. JC2975 TaxID=2729626 RepID=UPI0014761E08|nr:hypothetical protein [Planctomonas sp. JC2975]NNC11622.1 hypothetical protein [Planctomonas sp. JC2975]
MQANEWPTDRSKSLGESNEFELDFTDVAFGADLLAVKLPKTCDHVVAGRRLIVTSVEFWTTRAVIRYTWPMFESHRGPLAAGVDWRWVVDQDGVDYGISGGGARSVGIASDAFISTADPVPADVQCLTVTLPEGSLTVELCG